MKLTADIDEEDTIFVALNDHLKAHLWTGDKKLTNGLRDKGYDRIISTDEVYSIFLKKELQRRRKKR
jgi:predicted nucleic acid-binding protein